MLNTAITAYCMALICHDVGRIVTKTTKESLDRDLENTLRLALSGITISVETSSIYHFHRFLGPLYTSVTFPHSFRISLQCLLFVRSPIIHPLIFSQLLFHIKTISIHNNAGHAVEEESNGKIESQIINYFNVFFFRIQSLNYRHRR